MKKLVLIFGLLGSWMTFAACPVVISSSGGGYVLKKATMTKLVDKALGKKDYYVADEDSAESAKLHVHFTGMMTTRGDYLVGVNLTLSDSHGMEEKVESFVDLGVLQFLSPVVARIGLKRSLRDLSNVLPYCSR